MMSNVCPFCDAKYDTRALLSKHKYRDHGSVYEITLPNGKSFKVFRTDCNNTRLPCVDSDCDMSFARLTCLRRHVLDVHYRQCKQSTNTNTTAINKPPLCGPRQVSVVNSYSTRKGGRSRKLRRNAQTSQLSDPESIGDATPYTASQVKDDSFWAQSRSAQLVAMSMVKHYVDQGEMVRSKARITGLGARGHRFYESLLFVRIAAPVETPVESTTTPQTEMTVFLSRRAVEDILGIRYSGMIYKSSVYLRDMLRALEEKLPMMSVVELTFLGSKIDLPIVRRLKTELDPSIPHYLSKSLWSSHHDDSNDDDIKEEGGEEEAQLFALTQTLRCMLEPEL